MRLPLPPRATLLLKSSSYRSQICLAVTSRFQSPCCEQVEEQGAGLQALRLQVQCSFPYSTQPSCQTQAALSQPHWAWGARGQRQACAPHFPAPFVGLAGPVNIWGTLEKYPAGMSVPPSLPQDSRGHRLPQEASCSPAPLPSPSRSGASVL